MKQLDDKEVNDTPMNKPSQEITREHIDEEMGEVLDMLQLFKMGRGLMEGEDTTSEDLFDHSTEVDDRIDERIKELERIEKLLKKNDEEEKQKIIASIKKTLDQHDLLYMDVNGHPNVLKLIFDAENKHLEMMIILQNKKVVFDVTFPCVVQCNSLALISLYIAQANEGHALGQMNINLEKGIVSMRYSFIIHEAAEFIEHQFMAYMYSLLARSQEVYTRLNHLAVGKVAKDIKELYKTLLEQSLDVINGIDSDDDSIIYGCEELRTEEASEEDEFDASDILGNLEDEADSSDDEETESDELDDEDQGSLCASSFKDFLRNRMMHQLEGSGPVDISNFNKEDDIFLPFETADTNDASIITDVEGE